MVKEVHNIVNGGECQRGAGVCTAVVDADSAGVGVNKVCAGEYNGVGIADKLVILLWAYKVRRAAPENLPRLILVQKRCREAVNVAVAGG